MRACHILMRIAGRIGRPLSVLMLFLSLMSFSLPVGQKVSFAAPMVSAGDAVPQPIAAGCHSVAACLAVATPARLRMSSIQTLRRLRYPPQGTVAMATFTPGFDGPPPRV